jgi:NAD(P)-dependent dehydrogenase (short-subunit alcohol dehydrogenase family)
MTKTIFITGASTGLGRATTRLFANKGWNVVATMRKPESSHDLQSLPNVTVFQLDVTNPDQIQSVTEKAIQLGNVDVVFNNAGYGLKGPLEGTSDAQLMLQINTNLLGVIRVTKAFIAHFRSKKSGTFVTTTSIGGLVAVPLNSAYHATKWALEGWSESMAFELNLLGIDIKTVSPGFIHTDFAGRSLDTASHPAYEAMAQKVANGMQGASQAASASTAEQIAEVVFEAATDGKRVLRYLAGQDAKAIYAQRLAAGDEVFREGLRQRFFCTPAQDY